MNETFTCALCNQTFEKEWSDEEAIAEAEADFGYFNQAVFDVICDDCYRAMVESLTRD